MWDDPFKNSALVVVDAQRGFSKQCEQELPVPGAVEIIPTLNRLLMMPWKSIYATQDWHPATHCSFKTNGGHYSPHCIKNTKGADFLTGLFTERFHAIFRKGFHSDYDSYSAQLENPGFVMSLYTRVKSVYVAGICTNICVYETAFDLKTNGVKEVLIIEDACAKLDLPDDDPYNPVVIKQKATSIGIKYINSDSILPIL